MAICEWEIYGTYSSLFSRTLSKGKVLAGKFEVYSKSPILTQTAIFRLISSISYFHQFVQNLIDFQRFPPVWKRCICIWRLEETTFLCSAAGKHNGCCGIFFNSFICWRRCLSFVIVSKLNCRRSLCLSQNAHTIIINVHLLVSHLRVTYAPERTWESLVSQDDEKPRSLICMHLQELLSIDSRHPKRSRHAHHSCAFSIVSSDAQSLWNDRTRTTPYAMKTAEQHRDERMTRGSMLADRKR